MLLHDEMFDEEELMDSEESEESEHTDEGNSLGGKRLQWIYSMRRRMRELLALPAPACEERDYLVELGVPPENIDNCMLIIGVLFRLAVDGNMRAFQELRHIVGDNETHLDRRLKLAQLKKINMQIEDMKRKNAADEENTAGDANALAEALEESAASLWQNGGAGSIHEQEEK